MVIRTTKIVRVQFKLLATIFISHSQRDEGLVLTMKKILENMGHTPIIEELVPAEEQASVPHEEIRKNVEKSDFVFLFLTDNIVATPHTRNWVSHEVGVAAANSKKLFVFERIGTPIPFPIPYLTDYAPFNPDKTEDILALQGLTRNLGKFPRDLLTAGGGAMIGTMFGPIGTIIGAGVGYAIGPKLPKPPTAKCNHCNIKFNYHSTHKLFDCPACRKKIDLR